MLKPRHNLLAMVLLAAASTLHAQSSNWDANSNPSVRQVRSLLRSSDPRLVAWGAYFASRSHDAKTARLMIGLAERWKISALPSNTDEIYRRDAMSEILYALIERKESVPPKALNAIASSFPSQALILASRLPNTTATPLLQKWYYADEDGFGNNSINPSLALISAMMLAKVPPPGFAASILSRSEEHLIVYVTNTGGMGGSGFGVGCGDSFAGAPPSGWPMLFHYELEDNNPHTNDPVLVEAAGDRITWHFSPITEGWGSCFYVGRLDDNTRHHILAAVLGIKDTAMPWKERQQVTINWKNRQKFLRDLTNEISSEEAKLQATVQALYKRGLLTRSEAASVRPKLRITISDYRKPPAPPLPRPANLDSHTFLDYFPNAPQILPTSTN